MSEETNAAVNAETVELLENLQQAVDGSYYTIRGVGGELSEWTEGMNKVLEETGVGKPTRYYRTVGAAVNEFAGAEGLDRFKPDLTFLMFPLDDLNIGKLAMIKIKAGDTWFDDMIANMRPVGHITRIMDDEDDL